MTRFHRYSRPQRPLLYQLRRRKNKDVHSKRVHQLLSGWLAHVAIVPASFAQNIVCWKIICVLGSSIARTMLTREMPWSYKARALLPAGCSCETYSSTSFCHPMIYMPIPDMIRVEPRSLQAVWNAVNSNVTLNKLSHSQPTSKFCRDFLPQHSYEIIHIKDLTTFNSDREMAQIIHILISIFFLQFNSGTSLPVNYMHNYLLAVQLHSLVIQDIRNT